MLHTTSVHRRGERNARQKVICVFHAPFTFPLQQRRLNFIRIFVPLPLQRPQKHKMSKTNCDRHRSALGLPSFLILVCGNDFTRPTGDINLNCPLYTKRPPETKTSTKIFVNCHFSFGDQHPLGGSLQKFHGVQQEELYEARRLQRDLPHIWADSRYAWWFQETNGAVATM